jgi:CheY-like chemotaxis protein
MTAPTQTVLLVEDNPHVLALLERALEKQATIMTAADAADAVLRASESQPDLIVADFSLPGMDGLQLVHKLRSRPATAKIPVVLMATKNDIHEKLHSAQEWTEEIIEKPFMLDAATAVIRRALERVSLRKLAQRGAQDGVIRGQLSQLGIIDLLQGLEMGRKTCRLRISSGSQSCEIYLVEGQAVHAELGQTSGEQAVYGTLAWNDGSFELDFAATTEARTIVRSTQALLMEGLRLLDEANQAQDIIEG